MDSLKRNLPAVLQTAGTTLSVLGGLDKASAQEDIGARKRQLAGMEASQLRENAKLSVAAGIQESMEQQRQGRLAASRTLALAAASGGGASDPTVMNIIANLSGQATYQAMTALYEGQERARLMEKQAVMTEYGGTLQEASAKSQAKADRFGAFSTAAKDAISMYQKYGQNSKPATFVPQDDAFTQGIDASGMY